MQNFLQILLTFEETLSPADRAKAAARPLTEAVAGEPWPTAAIPMENPYCSCELTRVRSDGATAYNSCNPHRESRLQL